MVAFKSILSLLALTVSVVFAYEDITAELETERGLKKVLKPQKGKQCTIKKTTKTKTIKYGDGNAVKCAEDCLKESGCKGIQYNDKKNRCWLIFTALNYKFKPAPAALKEDLFCGRVYKREGGNKDPSYNLSWYDCRSQTLCKDVNKNKSIVMDGSVDTAAKCAKACATTTNCRSFQFDGSGKKCTVLQYRTRSVTNVLPTAPVSMCCKAPK